MDDSKNMVLDFLQKDSQTERLELSRIFTQDGIHPFDEVEWSERDARVGSFEQRAVEFPVFWSDNAVNITASKYFRGKLDSPERERSLKQMIGRVVQTIRGWGEEFEYFKDAEQAQIFEEELTHLLIHQKGSFNSPVWFNVGVHAKPQCSACFILSVEDDMSSILDWIRNEGLIFKRGSGAGINLSNLRSAREGLSGGGIASGPVSFMRGADSVAGMIKSGGATRRAAKMVVLDIDHPDIKLFIRCKADEEKKIRALIDAGYDMADLNNPAWDSVQFQNANNSVRVTDEFMQAAAEDGEWQTKLRTTGQTADTYRAKDLLDMMAEAAWESGDPGLQFDTTINDWHTCPNSGRINASNPCSEYMHLDDSACNLASINLLRFLKEDGGFAVNEFKQAVRVFILAQEILINGSGYPTEKIAQNARDFRELGLGFANLGALLMAKGLPYDSDEGRAWAGAITSLMSGEAYRFSAELAELKGSFEGYGINKEPMLKVIAKHRDKALAETNPQMTQIDLAEEAVKIWNKALDAGRRNGFRNSQVTVIAPTGTIAFMMDCDTTGIEPDFSLIKTKQLVGGGWMKIINRVVPSALASLGYGSEEVEDIVAWIAEHGSVEGAPHIQEKHLAVFDTAICPKSGTRAISWKGHIKMVAAVQPFISGAISKTFNMPNDITKDEIKESYVMAWKLGIKALAVYRDGSKASQPLATSVPKSKTESGTGPMAAQAQEVHNASRVGGRERLPDTRSSETHRFVIAGHKGYLTYSAYEDGRLAEIFVRMAKQGSTLAGLLDAFALSISIALQHGVPLQLLAEKHIRTRFEPAGYTENSQILVATSIVDYIFRYLALRFLPEEDLFTLGLMSKEPEPIVSADPEEGQIGIETKEKRYIESVSIAGRYLDNGYVDAGVVCQECGGMMVQSGSCYTCLDCGGASGGCS
ncbi:MAG: vitamin B12-dependent ribonucleotide reductase [Candidatus Colwellbacteria bacterium]|nr:vitamin B12-dependent ribonucleotide reductase [Candidatus Colwellbacteria bacterium]